MGQLIDMKGQKVGRLTVLERSGSYVSIDGGKVVAVWKCQCKCGNIKYVRGDQLRRQTVRSCGCLRKESLAANQKKRYQKTS